MGNQLQITQDGSHTLLSEKYGVTYHSKYGAIQESMHVFIEAGMKNLLNNRNSEAAVNELSILEIGFGTGLNVYLTLLEVMNHPSNLKVNYTSLETSPISQSEIDQLNYPTLLKQDDYESFNTLHACDWASFQQITPNFQLKKINQPLEVFETTEKFDLIFFDAFAPESQPELWEVPIFQKLFDCINENGVLTTYCAKGQVKRNMKAAGFKVEGIPGPPGKREMTRATKSFLV